MISPKNEITQYQYLPTGELAKIIDPKQQETTFEYDKLGRLISKKDTKGKISIFEYDSNGNRIKEIDPNGNIKKLSYDVLNRLNQVILPDDTLFYGYSPRGEMQLVANRVSRIDLKYDSRGRLAEEAVAGLDVMSSYPGSHLQYAYNSADQKTSATSAGGNLFYDYDQGGRLVGIRNTWGDSFGFSYDLAHRLTTITRPSGSSTLEYNTAGSIQKISHNDGSSNVKSFFEYSYDQRNYPNQKRTVAGDIGYQYDSNGQLTASAAPNINENFSYDKLGNRIADQDGNYVYDTEGVSLQEDYSYVYSYDNNGNMLSKINKDPSKKGYKFQYSSTNQLIKVQILSGTFGIVEKEVLYSYDALGRRMKREVIDYVTPTNSKTKQFVYDGQNILFEYDGLNNLMAKFTHSPLAPDDVLSVMTGGGRYYYLKDHLGTITDVQDSGGNVVQRYEYSVFGKITGIKDGNGNDILTNPVVNTSFTYTGREYESEYGMYYYRARYYDPSTGRFLQKDPDPGKVQNPTSVINAYSYVGNLPTLATDPSGTSSFFGWILAAAFPIQSLILMNTTNFFQSNFGFSRGDIRAFNSASLAAIIIAASILTGGAAGTAVGGGWAGAGAGALAGAATGAIIGAIGYPALGLGTTRQGATMGAILGGVSGGMAGYYASPSLSISNSAPTQVAMTDCEAMTLSATLAGTAMAAGAMVPMVSLPSIVAKGLLYGAGTIFTGYTTGYAIGCGTMPASAFQWLVQNQSEEELGQDEYGRQFFADVLTKYPNEGNYSSCKARRL
ncbi:MAG: hypothetical protein BroJett040_00750 [Oligoflexia bacterium]|nr:MAG: hypothetical protein BroJett040_00750 [Oligoflexia bacterium]